MAATQMIFSFAANSVISLAGSSLVLPVQVVNPGGRYRNAIFVASADGIHFVEMCVSVSTAVGAQVRSRSCNFKPLSKNENCAQTIRNSELNINVLNSVTIITYMYLED
jgi:hypothetical protein